MREERSHEKNREGEVMGEFRVVQGGDVNG